MIAPDDLRSRNSGFRVRTRDELRHDLTAACVSLGATADRGIGDADPTGIKRTADGIRRVLVDLRALAQGGAA